MLIKLSNTFTLDIHKRLAIAVTLTLEALNLDTNLVSFLTRFLVVLIEHDLLVDVHGEFEQQHLVARNIPNMFTRLHAIVFIAR
jgi:hypothetical protein